jgi:hypothetical protein
MLTLLNMVSNDTIVLAIGLVLPPKKESLMTEPLDSDDDLFTLEMFIDACKNHSLIDDDGYGCYSNGKVKFPDKVVYPSDVEKGRVRGFSHVVWFNR